LAEEIRFHDLYPVRFLRENFAFLFLQRIVPKSPRIGNPQVFSRAYPAACGDAGTGRSPAVGRRPVMSPPDFVRLGLARRLLAAR
jgi:hypothetical protein